MIRTILIAGPTASGKTACAIRLAKELDGVIVNADSMQVYRDLRVLTARPDPEELAAAEHRLFGYRGGEKPFSVSDWLQDAEREVKDIWASGRTAILVGGTGLYFRAALEGLAEIPDIPSEIRDDVRDILDHKGAGALYKALQEEDPLAAKKLNSGDSQRLSRALEVVRATKQSIVIWQENTKGGFLAEEQRTGSLLPLVLHMDRDILYGRVNKRFEQMLLTGALEEVKALKREKLPKSLPVMKALGVPFLSMFLDGELTLEEATEKSKTQSRRYAKRQLTWFRNQFDNWTWVRADDTDKMLALIREGA